MNTIIMTISTLFKKIAVAFAMGCILSIPVYAQEQDEPASATSDQLELYKSSNLWLNTLNAAGMNVSETFNYTDVNAGYTYTKGGFCRPQEGERNNGFLFNAEGATTLKGAYLWGKFSLETEKKRGARFNASIIDPFRGMPYIIADDRSSEWRLQYYNLSTKVSSPKLFDRFYAGIGIDYNVSTGAKQLDPRPKNRYYALELTPSMVWSINNIHSLGGVFYYKNLHETSNIEMKNSSQNATFYYLEGLGSFTQTTGTDRNRDYRGNSFGGELQYSIRSKALDVLWAGGYMYSYENVIDGLNKIINDAKTVSDNYFTNVTFVFKEEKHKHHLLANASYQNTNGIFYDKTKDPDDPVVGQIILYEKTRSKFKTTRVELGYDYYKLQGTGYSSYIGAKATYQKQEDIYLLPQPDVAFSFQDIHRCDFNVHGKYHINKGLPFDGQLLIGASAVYSLAHNCELNYGGPNENHIVITELLNKDFLFLSESYWKLMLDVQYSIPLKVSNRSINAYGRVNGYLIPEVNNSKRANITVSIGFML